MKSKITLLIATILCLPLAACSKVSESDKDLQETYSEVTNPESSELMQQQSDNPVESGNTEGNSEEPVQPSIELVGPWHLDSEKNDLAAFSDSLDLFPGYGEWGASMEIRSDGQISWYIGAVGGCGTYSIDDDLLHAALVNDMDQKDIVIDFRILVGNEKAVLEMNYHDMAIYWVYGGQEDAPAIGNDESLDDIAYPGADVVEIVNLRGDETTVYKLADGTYMDRIERHFTYNGSDIWTDENGVEWNEAAKD
ncbi:MAG: hypothetical protein SOZ59_11000 [Candidatus Limivivens sp.]|nr:hypothetical protein [Candidatus Limivivens sp.]